MITPAQENQRMLARILGIDEDSAALQLAQTFAITAGQDEPTHFASELHAQLERTVTAAPADASCDIEVVIHAHPIRTAKNRLFVEISSDRVVISSSQLENVAAAPLHGIQRMIAACYCAGVVLAALIDGIDKEAVTDPFTVRFDALGATKDVLATPIALEDTVLVGAGAVGNGFLRAARHLDISGVLVVADPKVVGSGNPNRCLYFTPDDEEEPKAPTLTLRAQPDFPRLTLLPHVGMLHDIVEQQGRIRRVIVGTDSRVTRRSVQNDLPFEVLDASTTGAAEIIVHSHREPNKEACLSCIYPHIPDELSRAREIAAGLGLELSDVTESERIDARIAKVLAAKHSGLDEPALVGVAFDSLFKQLCAEQTLLSATGEQTLAPFAFVSNLAGAMLALELARLQSGARFADGKNYMFLSPWSPPHSYTRRMRPRIPDCEFCGRDTSHDALALVWPELKTGT